MVLTIGFFGTVFDVIEATFELDQCANFFETPRRTGYETWTLDSVLT